MEPQGLIREVGGKIGPLGGAFMMHPETGNRGEEIGLDFLAFYALGRGGVLGNVEADVVASAFFYFEPSMVARTWNAGREKVDPQEAAEHYAEACRDWGRIRLRDVEGLDDFNALAEKIVTAGDARGLATFAGWRTMPLPEDAPGRAMQLVQVLREFRGGANGLATRAVGLSAPEAIVTRTPHMLPLFGWQTEPPDPEPLREKAARAEDLTDEIVASGFSVLDEDEQRRLAQVVEAMGAAAGLG